MSARETEAYDGELAMLRGLARAGHLTITAVDGRTTYYLTGGTAS